MFTFPRFVNSLYIGIFSGILLGLLMKFIQSVTNINVYTLLLNVDFIPFIGEVHLPETIEFLFHVLISIVIAFVFVGLADRLYVKDSLPKLWLLSFFLCLPTFGLYFLLSELAIKDVPEWDDWHAFAYWTLAHLFYVWILPMLYKKKREALACASASLFFIMQTNFIQN